MKNTHLSTLFIEKGRTVPADRDGAVSNRQYEKYLSRPIPKSLGMSKIGVGNRQSITGRIDYMILSGATFTLNLKVLS